MMKWIIAMAVPSVSAIGAAWVYLDAFLATKRNKEALVGNAFISFPYWAFLIAVLIPVTVLLAVLVWRRLETRRNRIVVVGFDVLLIASALVVPELIINTFWK